MNRVIKTIGLNNLAIKGDILSTMLGFLSIIWVPMIGNEARPVITIYLK